MYCANCGSKVEESYSFCNICGAKIHIVEETANAFEAEDNIGNNKSMRTAKEMLAFAQIRQNANEGLYRRAFEEIQMNLRKTEKVDFCFVASSLTRRTSSMLCFVATAVTNERIIIGGQIKGLLKVSYTTHSLSLKNVNSVNETYFIMGGDLSIETLGDTLKFGMESREAVGRVKGPLWDSIENNRKKLDDIVQENSTFSAADELLKYKQLLDMGAISQEEYDIKKKDLLG